MFGITRILAEPLKGCPAYGRCESLPPALHRRDFTINHQFWRTFPDQFQRLTILLDDGQSEEPKLECDNRATAAQYQNDEQFLPPSR